MARKHSVSLARGARVKKNAKSIPDSEINFSDITELSDQQLEAMKPLGRPLLGNVPRKLIAVRIDQDVLNGIRREAKKKRTGYQSLINDILAKYVKKSAA